MSKESSERAAKLRFAAAPLLLALTAFDRIDCGTYDVRMVDKPHGSSPLLASGEREDINRIAAAHGARNVRVFGSVGRGESSDLSDLDLLVDMSEGRSLLDLVALGDDLEEALGVAVDVVTEKSLSPYLRDRILAEAVAL
jgi:predicted nucleotidyltransferase